ncbi:hypothetical protein WME97_01255 [Sorangium sp. So ce367]|uniref:hypothetical protein n=1 Tax=Sorangium sp. So ce367 TaxID=3133305 RepID=UPI003F5E980D
MSILVNAPSFDKLGLQATPPPIGYAVPVEIPVSVWPTDGSTSISKLKLTVAGKTTGLVQLNGWRMAFAKNKDMTDATLDSITITFDTFSNTTTQSVWVQLVQGSSRTQGSYTLTVTPASYTASTEDEYNVGIPGTGQVTN